MQKIWLEIFESWTLIFKWQVCYPNLHILSKKSTLSLILLFISQIDFIFKDMTHFLFVLKYAVALVTTKLHAWWSSVDEKSLTKELEKIKKPDDCSLILMSRKTYHRLLTTAEP